MLHPEESKCSEPQYTSDFLAQEQIIQFLLESGSQSVKEQDVY